MVNIEKHLIEIETCKKDHLKRDNSFTVAVLEQAHEVAKELQKYRDAEEQGLLPRFHLGDEFWTTRLDRVVKAKVVMLQQKKDGSWKYRLSREISSEYHNTIDFEESDYGKYFFATKEEAEQKLAERTK
jgi:hypothetical protein